MVEKGIEESGTNEVKNIQDYDKLKRRINTIEKQIKICKKQDEELLKKKIYLEKYKLMSKYVFYQDNNFYFLFSIFGALNGLIMVNYIIHYKSIMPIGIIGIPFLGLFISIIWLLVSGRSLRYHDDRILRAYEIQTLNELKEGKFERKTHLELWDKNEAFFRREYSSGRFSATEVCMLFIYFIIMIWFFMLMFSLFQYFIYSFEVNIYKIFFYISLFLLLIVIPILLFDIDICSKKNKCFMRWNLYGGRRRKYQK